MKYIVLLLAFLNLTGCGSRVYFAEYSVKVDNDIGLFQSNSEEMENAILGSFTHKLSKTAKRSKYNSESQDNVIRLILLSDKTKFNPSWFWGDGYTRTIDYKININGTLQMAKVSVDTSKDGAIDRFVGHVTGLGSHPGYRVFPGTLGVVIDKITNDLLQRIE